MSKDIRILIIGCGSIGKRHIRNLINSGYKNLSACRTSSANIKEIEEAFGIRCFSDINKAFAAGPEITFVCTPTSRHMPYVTKALKSGSHVFVEKPISHNLKGITAAVKLSRKLKKIIFVGYQWRFHPIIRRLKKEIDHGDLGRVLSFHIFMGNYLPNWHPYEDYRAGYAGKKSLGGGPILTLSHEIDYAQFLFGQAEKTAAFAGHMSRLEIDTEDTADLAVKFKNGVSGTIHLDYVSDPVRQGGNIILENGAINWDLRKNFIKIRKNTRKKERVISFRGFDINKMYIDEVKAFLKFIQTGKYENRNLLESVHSLKIALAALKSIKEVSIIGIKPGINT